MKFDIVNSLFLLYEISQAFINCEFRKGSLIIPQSNRGLTDYMDRSNNDPRDIRIITRNETKVTLESWLSKYEPWNIDIHAMLYTVNKSTSDDVFFAYCPLYNKTRDTLYIFHTRMVVINNLCKVFVENGIQSPYDKSGISSYRFKKLLPKILLMVEVDFSPIMSIPKFRLSWNIESI